MNSKYIIQAAVTALMIAQNAQAADAVVKTQAATPVAAPSVAATPANPNAGLYRQLDELRSQNAILTETLKNAKLKNDISNVGTNPISQPGMTLGGPLSYQGSAQSGASAPLSGQVQMVSGSENKLTALISLSNGGRVTVRVGSNIAGVGVVKSISKDEVMVASKTQIISLPFALDAAGSSGGTGIPAMPQMSPMPQGMIPGGVR
jgi:type IV pilus biogenesis protein PilP